MKSRGKENSFHVYNVIVHQKNIAEHKRRYSEECF